MKKKEVCSVNVDRIKKEDGLYIGNLKSKIPNKTSKDKTLIYER